MNPVKDIQRQGNVNFHLNIKTRCTVNVCLCKHGWWCAARVDKDMEMKAYFVIYQKMKGEESKQEGKKKKKN